MPVSSRPPVTAPSPKKTGRPGGKPEPDRPWLVIVWNDPINLMAYVVYVFQKVFGYSKEKATELMLKVHRNGKAVVASGPREQAEHYVYILHQHGLWATMKSDR
jgi:ATP-dependent Clp protease adaptor protein ClpS